MCGLHFLAHFGIDGDETLCGVGAVQGHILTLLWSDIRFLKEINAALLLASKYFSTGLHSDIYEQI